MKPIHALTALLLVLVLAACQPAAEVESTLRPSTAIEVNPTGTVTAVGVTPTTPAPTSTAQPALFDGQRAYDDVIRQEGFGPRVPGSAAHQQAVDWMQEELRAAGWEVEIQQTSRLDHPIQNIIAKRGSGAPWIILGAHYDSRLAADQDPDPNKQQQAVPGANDGASGVAILLELARTLPENLNGQIWLVFFDAEDQGRLPGWDWILGSRAFVDLLEGKPQAVVIVDMVGDANLNIHPEQNSDPKITAEIWDAAKKAGYEDQFLPEPGYSILDDHTPFLEKGIPAVDIIDFDYPYWHTTGDTSDKVSAQSLEAVGRTLQNWLVQVQALAN